MATKTKAKTAPKVSHAKPQKAVANDLSMRIATDLIDTTAQVRSAMDPDALQDLAVDIQANGILQNLLVTEGPKKGRYTLVAGHRRLAAARIAKIATVPARIITTKRPQLLQLAENIQREELSLEDTAKAVRQLYDDTKSVQTVAELCHKSKPWVSKRLAVTFPTFGYRAQTALEDGLTGDLEILKALSDVEAIDRDTAEEMFRAIKGGKMTRAAARNWLQIAKRRIADREAKENARLAKQTKTRQEAQEKPAAFSVTNALWQLGLDLKNEETSHTVENLLAKFTPEQREQLAEPLHKRWQSGHELAVMNPQEQMRRMTHKLYNTEPDDDIYEAAWLVGFFHQPWTTLAEVLATIRAAILAKPAA